MAHPAHRHAGAPRLRRCPGCRRARSPGAAPAARGLHSLAEIVPSLFRSSWSNSELAAVENSLRSMQPSWFQSCSGEAVAWSSAMRAALMAATCSLSRQPVCLVSSLSNSALSPAFSCGPGQAAVRPGIFQKHGVGAAVEILVARRAVIGGVGRWRGRGFRRPPGQQESRPEKKGGTCESKLLNSPARP